MTSMENTMKEEGGWVSQTSVYQPMLNTVPKSMYLEHEDLH